jgi:tetratricopeptide (TPR) repeat protein
VATAPVSAGEEAAPTTELSRIENALEALRSRFFDEREKGIRSLVSLARTRKVAVGERILPLLEDPDPRLRLLGIRLLGEIAYKPSLPKIASLIPEMDTAGPWERATLIEAFEKFGTEAERHILERGFDSNPLGRIILGRSALPDVLQYIKDFFGEDGSPGWYDGQFDALRPRGKSAIYALMLIVETYYSPDDLTILEAKSEDAFDILWLSVHGLGELGDPTAVPILKSITQNAESISKKWTRISNRPPEIILRVIQRNTAIACWKCGDREPLVQRVRNLREEISELVSRVKSSARTRFRWEGSTNQQMSDLSDLYWDLAISLSSFGLVEEVVEAYRRNMYWKKRLGDPPQDYAVAQYNIACAWSKADKPRKGLQALQEAFRMGYDGLEWIEKDGDMRSVRALPEYQLVIAHVHVGRMKDVAGLDEEEHQKALSEALRRVGTAVTFGITDPSWVDSRKLLPVRNEPAFHWHAARFHAKAGRAETCARCLETALALDAARMQNQDPEERKPAFRIEEVETSPEFLTVRNHPAIRTVLKEHRGK